MSGFSGLIYEGLYINSVSSINWMANKHSKSDIFLDNSVFEGASSSWGISSNLG